MRYVVGLLSASFDIYGDIAQLVELRSCNRVVAITGWMSDCLGGNDSIFTWTSGSLFISNGRKDRNMPLKNSIKTRIDCQERREGRVGSWLDLVWIVHGP